MTSLLAPATSALRALDSFPRKLIGIARVIDAEAAREREQARASDRGPWVAFVVGALCLVCAEYTAGPRALAELLRALHAAFPDRVAPYSVLRGDRWYDLLDLGLWVATRTLSFFVVPALAIRFALRGRVSEFGLHVRGLEKHLGSYALLFLLLLPVLGLAAMRPEFPAYYPLYRRAAASWFDLLSWEGLYAFHFFCVEFFFRGFLPMATRQRFGSHAALAAMVPYVMTHFSKPLLEVLAAIPAGIVLGLLALGTRSIWGGVLLHTAIAWTMDALALLRTNGFPERFWPQ